MLVRLSIEDVREVYEKPLYELLYAAQAEHRAHFEAGTVQASQLLSIKTGGCPEDCAYCPQSAHHNTGLAKEALLAVDSVREKAKQAKAQGASRFCMGAAWREVRDGKDFDQVIDMVKAVKAEDLEVCCTLGMINTDQAKRLKEAGLYAYNHNIDTSEKYYKKIISTRSYEDRLRTIANVREAGLTVCTGGILGLGENDEDRIEFLHQLASFDPQPESVTVNSLVRIPGTPLEENQKVEMLTVIRVIAAARVLMPKSMIRLSAGRLEMSESDQLLCFLAGANSVFLGDKLLTSGNPESERDQSMLQRFGMRTGNPEVRAHV